jgi:hypothetical protein
MPHVGVTAMGPPEACFKITTWDGLTGHPYMFEELPEKGRYLRSSQQMAQVAARRTRRVDRSSQATCETRVVVVLSASVQAFDSRAPFKKKIMPSTPAYSVKRWLAHISLFGPLAAQRAFEKQRSIDLPWIATRAFCYVVIPAFVILLRLRRNENTRCDSRTIELTKAY